jgi:DNA invertase Pin-like site-specific DNA recombinase
MARVLGAVRQSKTRDRAVSPEVQRKDITRYAENNEHTLVEITEDLSRSGKVSAFKRPHLGPWLTEPAKIAKWDVLVTTKLDRACRDAWDFLQLRKWCEENGKVYVSLSENIDLSTASGRLTATQWAATAEFERERMRERRLETLAELEEQGRWKGGRIGYGLRAVQTEDGYYLEPDEGGTADVVRKMARMAIAGKSNGQIAKWLNSSGHKTGTRGAWRIERVRLVLHSENMSKILAEDERAELRLALSERHQERGQWTSGRWMLLRVAFCSECGKPLYAAKKKNRPTIGQYRCLTHPVSAAITVLEADVVAELRARWRDRPYRIWKVIPGDDHAKEIARLEGQLATARQLEFVDTSGLEAEIVRLRALPHEPDRRVLVDTGEKMDDHWNGLKTPAERGQFLRENGVVVHVTRGGRWTMPPTWTAEWVGPRA